MDKSTRSIRVMVNAELSLAVNGNSNISVTQIVVIRYSYSDFSIGKIVESRFTVINEGKTPLLQHCSSRTTERLLPLTMTELFSTLDH